mmetsp:Transcript_10506/g.20701  ORF Transcript_10506/g.20701 Transcript_10506/m.20701 type:complete len:312 (-) Transcript_10506:66-1001(-)|eukprot:CAMPEP_0173388954 /NCGR_PEP_ID=MMETSP1356-20130122/11141_1 /TAXON_ID=77927 ORGANISM="Hemiselmis virescens, Strain PCC157" /NCGR_SAMPLE_ID=MMETSP1356 /ASSEMBLY_ACC=CAM_ASM_000847 /LENGTH=311 /DNA_ID=CAMNT_0014345977 /DNA_START=252 /DNA_END=1187 /DNA_ORIENTATION=+
MKDGVVAALCAGAFLLGTLFPMDQETRTSLHLVTKRSAAPSNATTSSPLVKEVAQAPGATRGAAAGKAVGILQPAAGWKAVGFYHGEGLEFRHNFTEQWPSQVGQDRTIRDIFHGKRGGFFVDLAANDAVKYSNSLQLEQEYGWNGLCIEANTKYLEKHLKRRCALAVAAVGKRTGEVVEFNFGRGEVGGIIGSQFDNKQVQPATTQKVPLVSVAKLFEDFNVPSVIDYMSLDIEGAELYAFEEFPWDRYTFLTITVERPKGLSAVLEKNGYTFVRNHGRFGDAMFIHKSMPGFAEVMETQKNVGKRNKKH